MLQLIQLFFFAHPRFLKLLIENGASIEDKDFNGLTALNYAVKYKKSEMAKILIENGANVNTTCNSLATPLHKAVNLNLGEFVHLLLQNGASLNAKDLDKRTPIEGSLMKKQMGLFKTMIAYAK